MDARDVSNLIWSLKYRARGEGRLIDTFERVASAVASVEDDRSRWMNTYLTLLETGRFLPGGRILANAGLRHAGTLCNCFVSGDIKPSVSALFHHLEECVETLRSGGGVGLDASPLPPRMATSSDDRGASTDPVAYLRLLNAAAEAFPGRRNRRGAFMATLSCRHPDVQAFVTEPVSHLGRLARSVQMTDDFFAAVASNARWRLRHASGGGVWIRARTLLGLIARQALDCGSPGLLFVDRINEDNTLWWCERITTANPCGEAPMPAHGACALGSVNLCAFVLDPFTSRARLDREALEETTRHAVRFLDAVIDIASFPLPEQKAEALDTRRIGLGLTGLGDALVRLGRRYSHQEGRDLASEVVCTLRDAAYSASIALAAEKGSFPRLQREKFLQGRFARRLPRPIRDAIRSQGLRNARLMSIAPAGSISLLAGGVSSGLEPIHAETIYRNLLMEDGRTQTLEIGSPSLSLWRTDGACGASRPPAFLTADEISPLDQLAMQAALQPFVDGAISKTVMLPPSTTVSEVEDMILAADRLRVKGCTFFSPGTSRSCVLSLAIDHRASTTPTRIPETLDDGQAVPPSSDPRHVSGLIERTNR